MWWRKLVNLVFYSNLWIALAAAAMVLQSGYLLSLHWEWTSYTSFVFAATLCLYAVHRLVGVQKMAPFRDKGRFQIIWEYRSHIALYAVVAGLACFYFFLQLPIRLWSNLVVPCLLAVLYVLPAFGAGRRLRDLDYIKIFLIAITWSWLTVVIPADRAGQWWTLPTLLMALERGFFIFAITIPFDIRDLAVDAHTRVRTLPARFGVPTAKWMAYIALGLMLVVACANVRLGAYSETTFGALLLTALVSAGCVYYSDRTDKDYFYTGLVDGTMILQAGLVAMLH